MHKFSSNPHQYFEVDAMKLPYTDSHLPVFNLINYLNKEIPNKTIELIAMNTCPTGSWVQLFSGTEQKDSYVMFAEYANKHGSELGFPVAAGIVDGDTLLTKLEEGLSPVVEALENDFEVSLSIEIHWNTQNINSWVE